jgi:hypothetical protein
MRILRSIVAPLTAFMAFCDPKIPRRCTVRSQIICDELVWPAGRTSHPCRLVRRKLPAQSAGRRHAARCHYGIWDASTQTHNEALLNTNRFLADKAGITSGEQVLDAGCGLGGSSLCG